MGFRDFKLFNLACLAKQVWRLLKNPSSLWARLIKGLYFSHSSLWSAPAASRGSWVWQSLLAGRDVLKEGIRFNIADADLIDHSILQWKSPLLSSLFNEADACMIGSIPIAPLGNEDSLVWHFDNSGLYSVRSGYRFLVQPKIRVFLWKAMRNALPVRENLAKRSVPIHPSCPICTADIETIEHMLFWCDMLELCAITCSIIWKDRNRAIFENYQLNPRELALRIHASLLELEQALTIRIPPIPETFPPSSTVSWNPPPQGVLKLNFDVAYNCQVASIVVVVRNFKVEIIDGVAKQVIRANSLAGEAQTLLEAVLLAKNIGATSFIFESDSTLLISALSDPLFTNWHIRASVAAIKNITTCFREVQFSLIKRQANKAADCVAKLLFKNSLLCNWIYNLPSELCSILSVDGLGAS
ncbi:uncharacterized protein LOC110673965 [Hevea brasiliensis]|uniref:uncharacterized protein LOC110673965 n=1 Tax=Hevea brasiliensis TaxID=3981 RepID=UPI0025D6DDBB|nr:uncharacterized protein LOC110673965 [Hevea brasiliensis]